MSVPFILLSILLVFSIFFPFFGISCDCPSSSSSSFSCSSSSSICLSIRNPANSKVRLSGSGTLSDTPLNTPWNLSVSSSPSVVYPAVVPGTILTTLVAAGLYPDPYVDNNLAKIPDVADTGALNYTATYTTEFTLSIDETAAAQIVTLLLRGISYTANVKFNGHALTSRAGDSTIAGMYLRHQFDLTPYIVSSSPQQLSITCTPPPNLGRVNVGQGGDHQIARNAAMAQFMAGWDWIKGTPDRNTGLWDRVSLTVTDCLSLQNPHVVTALPNLVNISVTLENRCSSSASGYVSYLLTNTSQTAQSGTVTLQGGASIEIDFPILQLTTAQLWWPNGYGAQPLYDLQLSAYIQGSASISDSYELMFGVRTVSHSMDSVSGGPVFSVNNVPIFVRGGNWIATDQFFRYASNPFRYDAEVRSHAEMGLNLIRVWGGGLAEREEFYLAADRHGMLVMQEFWMTGDNNGRWAGSYSWPDDHQHYIACVQDTILALRNHPSLLFYCGGNELAPTSENPPADIGAATVAAINKFDPGRYYIPSSMGPDYPNSALAEADGPYGIQSLSTFFSLDPGLYARVPFNPESGNIGVPTTAALMEMFSDAGGGRKNWPQKDGGEGNVNALWVWHTYLPYSTLNGASDSDKLYAYGTPNSLDDFGTQAQLVNYQQYKALMEGHNSYIWTGYTGFIIWKTQSPWPALRGVLYDSALAPTASMSGLRHACAPIHLQLNQVSGKDYALMVVNLRTQALVAVTATAELFDTSGNLLQQYSFSLKAGQVAANSVFAVPQGTIPFPSAVKQRNGVVIFRLRLVDSNGTLLDESSDWLAAPGGSEYRTDIAALRSKKVTQVDAKAQLLHLNKRAHLRKRNAEEAARGLAFQSGDVANLRYLKDENGEDSVDLLMSDDTIISVTVTYPAVSPAPPAFLLWAQLLTAAQGDRLSPAFYSENYFTLMANDTKTFNVSVPAYTPISQLPAIVISGWNVEPFTIQVTQ